MNSLNLVLHTGAKNVDYGQVAAVQTPSATASWYPIAHLTLVQHLLTALPNYGLRVVKQAHGLWKDGLRYFGLYQVAGDDFNSADFGLVFGLRNSHDKKFPAGLALGSGVFICDNLAFSSEIVVGRKHTRFILRDLPQLISKAVGKLVEKRVDQQRRFDAYQVEHITDTQAHDLIIRAMRGGAINVTRVPDVVNQWHNPRHDFGNKTVWRLFNGFTEVLKESNLMELPNRTTKLHGLMDGACGLIDLKKPDIIDVA